MEFKKNIRAATVITSTLPPHHATNGYIIGDDGEALLIDPIYAPGNPLAVCLKENGIKKIQYAAITHPHPDHYGGVDVLLAAHGGKVLCHRYINDAMTFGASDKDKIIRFSGGEILKIGGYTIKVLHTPGHSPAHLCFYVEEEKILFSGDTILGYGTSIISPPEGNMSDYMNSLKELASMEIRMICPAHGPIIEERAPERIQWYIAHRVMREEKILDAIQTGLSTIPSITKAIYNEEDFKMHGYDLLPRAERSVLAHMEKLETDGVVIKEKKADGDHYRLG